MILQNELATKLANMNTYAASHGKDTSMLAELNAPLIAAIDAYYKLDGVETGVKACILALTHSQIRTGIVYEDGFEVDVDSSKAPLGYGDVTELFCTGSDILNTSDSQYTNSIKLVQVMDVDGVTVLTEHYESPLVDAWVAEFTTESNPISGLPGRLNAIAEFANGSGLMDPIKLIVEPSKMVSVPDLKEIAKDIYWNRKYLDVIEAWNLGIYIPKACQR